MLYKERLLTTRLRTFVRNFRVVVISGARQVGKSTLIRSETLVLAIRQSVGFVAYTTSQLQENSSSSQ